MSLRKLFYFFMAYAVLGVALLIWLVYGIFAGIAACFILGPVASMLWADGEKDTNSERLASIAKQKIRDEKRTIRKAKREEKQRQQAARVAKYQKFDNALMIICAAIAVAILAYAYFTDSLSY